MVKKKIGLQNLMKKLLNLIETKTKNRFFYINENLLINNHKEKFLDKKSLN